MAVGPHRGRGVPVLRGVFFQLEAVPLPVPMTRSECLPVLLTRAVAEAAFCSLGDWLKVCRTPRGVVAEPRDSWLEACRSQREQAYGGQGWAGYFEKPLLVWLTFSHPLGSLRVQSQIGHVSYTKGQRKREKRRQGRSAKRRERRARMKACKSTSTLKAGVCSRVCSRVRPWLGSDL